MSVHVSVTIGVGNCMSVSTGAKHARAIFAAYMHLGADAYVLSECADFWAATELTRLGLDHEYVAAQYGPAGSANSGVSLIYRKTLGELDTQLLKGTRAGHRRTAVRARPMLRAKFRDLWLTSLHAPLDSTGRRALYLAKVAVAGGVRGGDLNARHALIARLMPHARVHSVGVLHLLVPRRRWQSKTVRVVPEHELADADHQGLIVRIWR